MSWLWGATTNPQYEELVEKATSPLNLPYPQSEDISVSLEIADMIRSKAVLPKPAMQSLKRRVGSKNGRTQIYAMNLLDLCIKNGGDHFLAEIASKEFVDEMSLVIKSPSTGPEVKQMALKFFQQWALAFESKKELSFFVDVYHDLKNSGIVFPPPPAAIPSHLLTTTTAPTWVDSDVCMRCRTAFTFTNRKHHCRNCGLVFDQACSSHTMALPKFGIVEEVRICDGCWMKAGGNKTANGPAPAVPTSRTLRSRQDLDADLQRAIELSLAESQPSGSRVVGSEPPIARKAAISDDDDEEMRLAIEASLREMEKARPSAPRGLDEPEYKPLPTYDLTPREAETVLTLSSTLDQMAAYGERDLRRFPHVHNLYEQAYALGGKLQRNAEEKSTKMQMLMEMSAKISEATSLMGNIMDGQQEYAARQATERQQRQYLQHQQAYGYTSQQHYQPYHQQPYDPRYAPPAAVPQLNGHSPYPPYVPQQPYQAPPQQTAPSLYPSMANLPPAQYSHQQNYQPLTQPPQQNYYQEPATATYATPSPAPQQQHTQYSHSLTQPSLSRATSLHVQPVTTQPAGLQRHTSMTYGSLPNNNEPQPQQTFTAEPQPIPQAPPPVNMATHPASSPTSSVNTALPSAPPQSYTSPKQSIAPLPTSPATQSFTQTKAPVQTWQAQSLPQQNHQVQNLQQPRAQTSTQPSQPLYSAAMFPPAPAALFPDAPAGGLELPQGIEKEEQEEALLIKL